MRRARTIIALVICLAFTGSSLPNAQDARSPQDTAPELRQDDAGELAERRARWLAMSEEERALLRRRFEALRQMTPEQREQAEARLQRVREVERRLRAEASPRELREAEGLPRFRRDEFWRERVRQHEAERGRQLRERLPTDVVERLREASPDERRRMLDDLRHRHDWRDEAATRRFGERLGVLPEEIERWQALSPEERMAHMMERRRAMIERRVNAEGLPPEISPDEWERMRSLPDREFLETLRRTGLPERWRRPQPDELGPRPRFDAPGPRLPRIDDRRTPGGERPRRR